MQMNVFMMEEGEKGDMEWIKYNHNLTTTGEGREPSLRDLEMKIDRGSGRIGELWDTFIKGEISKGMKNTPITGRNTEEEIGTRMTITGGKRHTPIEANTTQGKNHTPI